MRDYNNNMCAVCAARGNDRFKLRPFSLEYLALRATLQNCIEKKTIDKYPFLTRELCQRKWYRWCFCLKNNNFIFHANDIIAITSEANNDNRRVLFEIDKIKVYCIFCYTLECSVCRYRRLFHFHNNRVLSSRAHYCNCDEKF